MSTGIYRIRNSSNADCYIGSCASKTGFGTRFSKHVSDLKKSAHHSPRLQNAWNKYGESNFVFEILLYCDPENCLMYEQIALDHFKPEYNICKIAGSQLGLKRSKNSRTRISQSKLGSKNPRFGNQHSESTRLKMSHAQSWDKNPSSKLTASDITSIKDLLSQGITQTKIALQFGVSPSNISKIKTGVSWK